MVYKRRIISTFMALTIGANVFLTSCSSKETRPAINGRSNYVYDAVTTEFYSEDGWSEIRACMKSGDYAYALVGCLIENSIEVRTTMYQVNSSGEITSEKDLSGEFALNYYAITDYYDGNFYYTTYDDRVCILNLESSEIAKSQRLDSDIRGVQASESGIYLLYQNKVILYDYDWNLISEVVNSGWDWFNDTKPVYETNGKTYVIAGSATHQNYYEVDFDSSESHLIYDPRSENSSPTDTCYGQYIFDLNGEYLLDFENSSKITLADWNGINMIPASYNNTPEYVAVDNEHFIKYYNYDIGMCEMQVYTYNPDVDYSDRIEIIIGGFDCRNDSALNWAVYNFNTSQDTYRAYIEDYSIEFGWDSVGGPADQQAALIQYFNDGNAPDIFYGDDFDYDLFAQNETIIDMNEFMGDEINAALEKATPSIRNLMINPDGSCYRIFAAYQLSGYIGASSVVGDNTEMSIEDICNLAQTSGSQIYDGELSTRIAEQAIAYTIHSNNYSEDDFKTILEYAFESGCETWPVSFENLDASTKSSFLLWNFSFFDLDYVNTTRHDIRDELTFIGYPTLNGSIHLANSFGQMAVSSSASNPEACIELILHLLDVNVQRACLSQYTIPVNDEVLETWFADSIDHSGITDDSIGYKLTIEQINEMDPETIDNFRNAIYACDFVEFYDWGLYEIIDEEVQSYYSQNKPVDEIASSLYSRINLYLAEQ